VRRRGREDDELVRWLAEGYAPAYRTAYLLLQNHADAEEAVQDAFLRAWRFRAAVPEGEGIRPWLYRVVVNASLSKLRADGRARRRDGLASTAAEVPREVTGDATDPELLVLHSERQRSLLDAVAGLPDHLRVVVALRYYAQLTEKEIATVIHRRPGTVKSRLHAARAELAGDRRLSALLGYEPSGEAGEA
jgi:RNA polymerase sigma-70 factor (ECF subfamily)